MSAQMAFAIFLVLVVLALVLSRLLPRKKGPDAEISATVTALLAKEFPLGTAGVEVKTFDGVVILGGFVREPGDVQRALEVTRGAPGVKSVDNRLSVRAGR